MTKRPADVMTGLRIVFSAAMLFPSAESGLFIALYVCAGVSDMLDGLIARKTRTESAFGEKLDSAADLIFLAVSAAKIAPKLIFPLWIWIWTAAVALMRLVNAGIGFVRRGRVMPVHTRANRLTGLMLFLLPIVCGRGGAVWYAAAVCLSATLAAAQEGALLIKGAEEGGKSC